MTVEALKKLVEDDGLSLETEEALLDLISPREAGELSSEEEQKAREILEWEKDSLKTKADFYDDLADAADGFVEEVEGEEVAEPDYDALIDEFVDDEKKEVEDLRKIMEARTALIGSDLS